MSDTSTEKKIIIALFTALVFTGGAGAFCISIERQNKVEIANEIRLNEQDISRLRRENEELSVKLPGRKAPRICPRARAISSCSPRTAGLFGRMRISAEEESNLKAAECFLLRHQRKLLSNEEK